MKQLTWLAMVALATSCQPAQQTPYATDIQQGIAKPVVIRETYLTTRDTTDNVDSPAFWQNPNGESWVILTAKETDHLVVYNAATGQQIRKLGSEGRALGQLNRPNGISVVDDLLFVVERDNHRVQVFSLPNMTPILHFGTQELVKPYGLAIQKLTTGDYKVWVTDNYETPDEKIPAPAELNKRVHTWTVSTKGNELIATHTGSFGEQKGPGVLYVVESIFVDPAHNQVLISEEREDSTCVKVYDLKGKFTGQILGLGVFKGQAEGIALYPCGSNGGYWILTDQSYEENVFHIYERGSLVHLGSFKGEETLNTDGIWVSNQAFKGFPKGAFFAVHDDGNLAVFDWSSLAAKLKLDKACE